MCFSDSQSGIYEEKEIHSMTFSASILELEASSPRLRLINYLTPNPHITRTGNLLHCLSQFL